MPSGVSGVNWNPNRIDAHHSYGAKDWEAGVGSVQEFFLPTGSTFEGKSKCRIRSVSLVWTHVLPPSAVFLEFKVCLAESGLSEPQRKALITDPNALSFSKLTNVTIEIAEEAGTKDWSVKTNQFGLFVWVKVFAHLASGVADDTIIGSSVVDLLYTHDAPLSS